MLTLIITATTILILTLLSILTLFTLTIILSNILTSQVDQFTHTFRNIQTSLLAEFRYNGKQWGTEIN